MHTLVTCPVCWRKGAARLCTAGRLHASHDRLIRQWQRQHSGGGSSSSSKRRGQRCRLRSRPGSYVFVCVVFPLPPIYTVRHLRHYLHAFNHMHTLITCPVCWRKGAVRLNAMRRVRLSHKCCYISGGGSTAACHQQQQAAGAASILLAFCQCSISLACSLGPALRVAGTTSRDSYPQWLDQRRRRRYATTAALQTTHSNNNTNHMYTYGSCCLDTFCICVDVMQVTIMVIGKRVYYTYIYMYIDMVRTLYHTTSTNATTTGDARH
jgi:hypothetical protein